MSLRLAVAGLLLASASFGQEAEPPADPPPPAPAFSDEVVVTATRREASLETVPVSVLAVSGERLRRDRIQTLEEMSRFVPNLLVGDGALTTNVTIRGMGAQPERSFEQSVGLFVDGISMPRSRQYRPAFLDVTRVEVLRGPQAVLFGLNATAGAVSVLTNRTRPGEKAFADVTADYELEHGGPRLTAVAGGSVSDWLGLRLAAQVRDGGDFYLNEYDGAREGGPRDETIRLSAVLAPSSAASIDVKYEHGRLRFDGDFGEQYGPPELNQLLLLGLPGADDGGLDWRRTMDRDFYPAVTTPFGGRTSPGLSQSHDEVAVKAGLDVGENRLAAVLGYSRLSWDSYADTDASALPIFVSGINESFDQKSLELSWTSPSGRTVDYLLGVYGQDSTLGNHQPNMFDPTFTLAPGAYGFDQVFTDASFTTDSRLWSAFATATWNVRPTLRLTGGLRYVDETKEHRRSATCVPVRGGVVDLDPSDEDRELFEENAAAFFCGTLDGYSGERGSSHLLPEAAVEWNSGDDVLWYGKYAAGAKSGGFAAALVLDSDFIEYDDEGARSFEVGLRSRLWGGRGRFNAALFRTRFEDLQLNAFNPVTGSGFVTNAAEARSQGIEVDGGWLLSKQLWVGGAFAWLDAKYTRFPEAPCPISQTLAGVEPPCDATGKTMPRAPEVTASLGVNLDQPLGSGLALVAGLNLGYTGEYDVDAALEPALVQDAHLTLAARVGVSSSDGRWTVALVGTNLTNEAVLNDALPFLSNIGYLASPRRVALQGQYRFGAR